MTTDGLAGFSAGGRAPNIRGSSARSRLRQNQTKRQNINQANRSNSPNTSKHGRRKTGNRPRYVWRRHVPSSLHFHTVSLLRVCFNNSGSVEFTWQNIRGDSMAKPNWRTRVWSKAKCANGRSLGPRDETSGLAE